MTAAVRKPSDEPFRTELIEQFHSSHQLMYRAAYSVTGNYGDAEDVVQKIFLRLIKGQPSSDFFKNPQGYLYRSAINEALKVVRTRDRWKLTEEDVAGLEIPAPPVESVQAHEDQIELIRAALAKMKPSDVETLNLRYKEGYSCSDIAKAQGKPLGTVLVTLYRAKGKLKKLIRRQEKHGETQKGKHERNRSQVLANSGTKGDGRGVGPGSESAAERA